MTDWVPFFQTALWVAFIAVLIAIFWRQVHALMDAVVRRVTAGATIKAGPVEIGAPPSILRTQEAASATAEGKEGIEAPVDIAATLSAKRFPEGIVEDVYLVHQAEVLRERTAKQSGRYRVRVWLESYSGDLRDITRVTYRLFDDFRPRTVVATAAREREFELWMNAYGEFTIVAIAERAEGPPIWLTRYLDLPGRPPE